MREVLKWTVIVGTFLLLFVPLIVADGIHFPAALFFPYITGKGFAFRIIIEIIFAAWVLLALYDAQYRPRFSWVGALLVAFVAIIFAADLFGTNPAKSFWSNFERMEGWVTLAHLLMYFFVASSVLTTEKLWKRFFNTALISCSLTALICFTQLAGEISIAQGGVRLEAWLGNAIYLAVYMLFNAFIALLLLAKSKNVWMRVLYGALAVVFSFLLIETATRGAIIIGLAGGLFVTALYSAIFLKDNRTLRKVAILGVAGVLFASGACYTVRDTTFVQESPIFSRIASIFSLKEALGTRMSIWGAALEGLKERPILGWGQSNFDQVFDEHYRPSLYAQEQWFDRVHNIVLDWLIAGGILGFAAYVAVWIAVLCALGTGWNNRFSVAERAVLIGLLVGYGLQNIVAFDNLISYIFFVIILAFVHVRVAKEMPRVQAFHAHKNMVTQSAVPIVALALCFSVYYINVPSIFAGEDLINALSSLDAAGKSNGITVSAHNMLLLRGLSAFKQALSENSFADQEIREQISFSAERVYTDTQASPETKSAYTALAESELQKHVTEQPRGARMHAFLGTFYRTIGKDDKALEQFAVVDQLSPNKQSNLFEIGATYIDHKEYEKAKEIFKRAFDLAPEYDEARAWYITAAIYTHDDALVAELSAPPHGALYREDSLILQTYYTIKDYKAVLSLLDMRIEKNPTDLQLRLTKAAVQNESGDTKAAIETLRQAIKDFPDFKTQGEGYIRQIQK